MTDYLEWAGQEGADALLEAHKRLEQIVLFAGEGRESTAGLSEPPASAQAEREPPLLLQVRRAERMSWQAAAQLRRGESDEVLPVGQRSSVFETAMQAAQRQDIRAPLNRAAEGMDTAGLTRQMELAFRRDSRRYDSGFYLY